MSRFGGFNQTVSSSRVIVNVYDLHPEMNENLYHLGLGMYHSGVQIGGLEYTFAGGAGIFSDSPRSAPNCQFRESIDMGEFNGTSSELDRILDELRPAFGGDKYNLLNRNCNTFSEALCLKLVRRSIPGFINRLATIGSYVECILPPSITGQQGPGSTNNGGNQAQNSSSYTPSMWQARDATPIPASNSFFGGHGAKVGGSGNVTTSQGFTPMDISTTSNAQQLRDARLKRFSAK
jgi:deubiquitinase DESI2